MSAATFTPKEEVDVFCRFCKKVVPAQLDRSIAGSGKTVDRASTFEYCCSKCSKTFCFSGKDLVEERDEEADPVENRDYSPKEHFCIGETITHSRLDDIGTIVGKDIGNPSRLLVQFKRLGLKKLVEGIS